MNRSAKDKSEHINKKEGRVSLMGMRRHCRSRFCIGTRLLTLSDNMSSLLAFTKGRSKSYGLNQLVRRSAAYSIAGRVQWCIRHVRSDDNASDESSRWHDPGVASRWRKQLLPGTRQDGETHATGVSPDIRLNTQPMRVEDVSKDSGWSNSKMSSQVPRALVAYLPLFVLELFSGSGRLTTAIRETGLAVLHPFEI